jgi:hypothetical protein
MSIGRRKNLRLLHFGIRSHEVPNGNEGKSVAKATHESDCYSLLREAFEHSPTRGNDEAAEPGGNSAASSQQGDREQVPGLQVMHEGWDAL